jgi:hypothetical protein
MDAIEKALGLLNDLSDWIDDEREQADAMVGKVGQSDAIRSRSYALKDVGRKVDAIKTQIAKMINPPAPAGIGSGTTPEDNMQRRLTDQEKSILDDYIDAAQRLELRGITVPYELGQQILEHNTTDGLPYVEPPLTDEDARQRPWVMVKTMEASPWQGPFVLIRERDVGIRYIVENHRHGATSSHTHVRRATAAEIAAAGLEVTE